MKSRCILVLLLACALAGAGAEGDLAFAQRLGARGFDGMANELLDRLVADSDPKKQQAGRYGKALLTKQQASRARFRFLRALEEGETPTVTRESVLALYSDAKPKIQDYVNSRKDASEPRFLLGDLLQEHAEFLTGANYPDEMADERAKLVDAHKDEAAKLFEQAVSSFQAVYDQGVNKLPKEPDPADPLYVRVTTAEYMKGLTRFRWALIYPKGANFQYRIDEAIEELDTFLQKHYDELFGAYAMLYLGQCFFQKGLRMGSDDDVETAINYFETVYGQVKEEPTVPQTSEVIGMSLFWYARACNALALKEGALKKAQPVYLENAIATGTQIAQRLKQGAQGVWALKARLEVAEAYAAQQRFEDSVKIAGEVLAAARVEGHRAIQKVASAKLKSWVASVAGAGALDPSLLFQLGESLAAQNRVGPAVTFYEKAVAACRSADELEKWAYPARLKIATTYRKDKRLFAAASVAWDLVQEFLKSGEDMDSDFGLTAGEACNQARLCWRTISDATKRGADTQFYNQVVKTFRDHFPNHPENSDAAFSTAMEAFNRKDFEGAAALFREINPSSKNYWRAQQRVPTCYRLLADREEDKAPQWHQKSLEAAQELGKLAKAKTADPGAKKALQFSQLYSLMAYGSLKKWEEALKEADAYLALYQDQFLKKGLELFIKLQAHLALGDVEKAEAALKLLKEKQPDSAYIRGANFDVYSALSKKYKPMPSGKVRTEIAGRAADLWQEYIEALDNLSAAYYYTLGVVMRDAHRWEAAGDAFEAAAEATSDQKQKSGFKLQAAEMQFKAAKEGQKQKKLSKKDYLKILEDTRKNFTDVLIPDKANQAKILQKLGNWQAYPSRAEFSAIKRRPEVILTAAEVYMEANPPGIDGRWVAVRLVNHLHSFTKAVPDPQHPKLDELIPLWWDATVLKLEAYVAIVSTGSGQVARTAKDQGSGFAKKILFTYSLKDNPELRETIQTLAGKLR